MNKKNLITGVLTIFTLAGCATGSVVTFKEHHIETSKEIGLDAPVTPWVSQIELKLRQKGFSVKRITRNETKALDGKKARYILVLEGSYASGWENRCFGGGYKFDHLTAELIDMEKNESLASVSGEGYSENCPPLSGTIFQDVASAVANQWK